MNIIHRWEQLTPFQRWWRKQFPTEKTLKQDLTYCKCLLPRLYNLIKLKKTPYEADRSHDTYEDLIAHAFISMQMKSPKHAWSDISFVITFLQGAIQRYENPKSAEEAVLETLPKPKIVPT